MNLIIVGNGFDCACGLHTQYKRFKEFLNKNHDKEYEFLSILFKNDFCYDEFRNYFEKNLVNYDFSNFDENQINIEDFESKIKKLKRDFCEWIFNENSKINKNIKTSVDENFTDSLIFSFNYTSTVE